MSILDSGAATDLFDALWERKEYVAAVAVYEFSGRPFWLTECVAVYLESQGMFEESICEWEHLIGEYFAIRADFLPLPDGPEELFLVAQWCADADKMKAIRYLRLYLDAERRWGGDPAFFLRYRDEAEEILGRLELAEK